jgi:hypothetical protein
VPERAYHFLHEYLVEYASVENFMSAPRRNSRAEKPISPNATPLNLHGEYIAAHFNVRCAYLRGKSLNLSHLQMQFVFDKN